MAKGSGHFASWPVWQRRHRTANNEGIAAQQRTGLHGRGGEEDAAASAITADNDNCQLIGWIVHRRGMVYIIPTALLARPGKNDIDEPGVIY